jgi:hypothetical protein
MASPDIMGIELIKKKKKNLDNFLVPILLM